MKTLTFFNEKGGVGKSLHTIMYASWLQYSVGAKVAVFDLESPTSRLDLIRRQELSQMEDPEYYKTYLESAPAWPTLDKGPWLKPTVAKSKTTLSVSPVTSPEPDVYCLTVTRERMKSCTQ